MALRRDLGLPTDPSYVAELERRWSAGDRAGLSDSLGIPLTDAESTEVDFRQEVIEQDAPKIRSYFGGSRANRYGGLYLDNQNGGKLTVLVTSGIAEARSALEHALTYPERLQVEFASNSLSRLSKVNDEIFDARDAWASKGVIISHTEVLEAENRVEVGVLYDPDSAAEQFATIYGAGIVQTSETVVVMMGTTYPTAPPFTSSQKIETVRADGNVFECSSGFISYRNTIPISYYMLTAGHCGSIGSAWTQGYRAFVGRADARDFSRKSLADTLRIPILPGTESNLVTIYYSPYLGEARYRRITSSQGQAADAVGAVTCHTGSRWTEVKCGTLRSVSFNYSGIDRSGAEASFKYGREAAFDCLPGDSGGGVFYDHQARGILSARVVRRFKRDTCIYGHIYDNLRAVGLTGVVTAY